MTFTADIPANTHRLDFRAFDKNGDGYIAYSSEFLPHLQEIMKEFDKTDGTGDGYISDGKGKYFLSRAEEDGVDELAAFQAASGIPFEKSEVTNATWAGDGYSFFYGGKSILKNNIYRYEWGTLGSAFVDSADNEASEYISLKQAADIKGGWIKVSDADRKLTQAGGFWDKYQDFGKWRDDGFGIQKAESDSFGKFLISFESDEGIRTSNITGERALDPKLDVLTPEAQLTLESVTRVGEKPGIRFFMKDENGQRILGSNGEWIPAENLRVSDILQDNFVMTDYATGQKITSFTFRDLVGYP